MPELAHFPAYVRTGCVRTYAAIDPKHAYRRDKRKRQGTTAMVIPCLCSFLLTVLSSASAGTCRGAAPPSCCARPFCRLKAPLGLSLLRYTPQPRTSRKQKSTRTLSHRELGSSTNCMVDGTGLEPVTSCTSSRCSTS